MRNRIHRLGILLTAAAFLAMTASGCEACNKRNVPPGGKCKSDGDCKHEGMRCLGLPTGESICVEHCDFYSKEKCPKGFECVKVYVAVETTGVRKYRGSTEINYCIPFEHARLIGGEGRKSRPGRQR